MRLTRLVCAGEQRAVSTKAVGAFLVAFLAPVPFGYYLTQENEKEIRRRFEERAAVPWTDDSESEEMKIPRDGEVEALKWELESSRGSYIVIHGPHAQGKSTLVKQALETVDVGRVYVSVPPLATLSVVAQAVGDAMGYNPKAWHRGHLYGLSRGEQEPSATWNLYQKKLVEIAKEHKMAGKRPPLLVIDNVDEIAKANFEAVEKLKGVAKEWADHNLITVVFVTSDGKALQMLTSGDTSRAKVIQGRDLSLEQAKTLLTNVTEAARSDKLQEADGQANGVQSTAWAIVQYFLKEVDHDAICEMVEEIVEKYTGGRVGFVYKTGEAIHALLRRYPQTPLEVVKEKVTTEIRNAIGVADDKRFRTVEAHTLMRALSEKRRQLPRDKQRDVVSNVTLTFAEAAALEGLDDLIVEELCSGNMFWLREKAGKKFISFQSACAATIAEECLKEPKPRRSLVKGRQDTRSQ